MKIKVGFVGWRGMVGSVLLERMNKEGDFKDIESFFFSTSAAGEQGPDLSFINLGVLQDAYSIRALSAMDVIVSCQGSEWTERMYAPLRAEGWKGYWIDAARNLRMHQDSCIVLDPVNLSQIKGHLQGGTLNYIGGNCTVSLMLLALHGLFKADLISWVSAMTYQAASGAGAAPMRELIQQMGFLHQACSSQLAGNILDIDRSLAQAMYSPDLPQSEWGMPLAGNLIPWVDKDLGNGQSMEEWKGNAEGNKILGTTQKNIPIDGICVRIGTMRCHSQGLTFQLKKDISEKEVEDLISHANPWVKWVPNNVLATKQSLSPAKVAGSLHIPVGRVRKMGLSESIWCAFTVGDQLLWGAAEPLRRMLRILIER